MRAIEQVSTEQGLDPRDFVLVPFGGAGPLHAARIAEELQIETILVPMNAGVLSAAGLLMADHVHYRSHTKRMQLDAEAITAVKSVLARLADEAADHLEQAGVVGQKRIEYIVEMRYVGQAFELSVPIDIALDEVSYDYLLGAFRDVHHRVFEFSKPPEKPAEIVSFRVGVHARTDTFPATSEPLNAGGMTSPDDVARTIAIVEGGNKVTCRVLPRHAICSEPWDGTLLVEDGTSTLYVPAGWRVHCDTSGNLIIKRGGQ